MNECWNLDPIYTGFEDGNFEGDLGVLKLEIRDFGVFTRNLADAEPLEGLRRGIAYREKISYLANKLGLYASLRQEADSRDTAAASQLGRVMGACSEAAGPEAAFNSWAAKIPNLMELVCGDENLKDYEFLFKNIADGAKYLLEGRGEEIMAKMELSGGNAWADLHGYLTSTVQVPYDGGIINLPAVRNLAYEDDPAVRKAAYEAELSCYKAVEDSVAYALNSIKLETINDCRLRGYEGPLDRTLKGSNMKKETLDAMFGAIDEYLPVFWKYLKTKAKAFGYENGLPWYDIFAPMGKASSKFTLEETKEYLVSQFATFDQEMADMVTQAFDDAWIDFYPRDGKSGGAFCAGAECLGESRILTNFDGLFGSVVTLAHELGHAFHDWCIRDQRPLNRDYSMPLAETASTFNECIVMNTAIANAADKEEKLALIESQLQDVTQIICDIYSRYTFESEVFRRRQEEFLPAETLCQIMLDAQKQCYGDGLDHNVLHPYMWLCKGHYYGPTFYNFPYAFGGLFARGLYAQYRAEGADFVPKYKRLLRATPIATAEDVAKVADIDLTDKQFWRDALQTVAEKIELFCQLVEE